MKRFSVSPVDTMVDRFRNTEERLASLERASSSGSGGGGGGADVVEGTTPPSTLPPGSFFFDTDCEPPYSDLQAQITALDARIDVLELPRRVAFAQILANVIPAVPEADITGLSVTWTAVATRIYKIIVSVNISTSVANDQLGLYIADTTNTSIQRRYTGPVTTLSNQVGIDCTIYVTGLTGSVTYKARAARVTGTGTVTVYANSAAPSFMAVEDVT